MRFLIVLSLAVLALFSACKSPVSQADSEKGATRHVISTFENEQPDEVHIYTGTDSLNRKEVKYYTNGALLSEGVRVEGKKDGVWRSYHLDGSLWSIHHYIEGKQTGEYNVWHRNGKLRISGSFKDGEETGKWHFMTEQGDTVRVVNYDGLH